MPDYEIFAPKRSGQAQSVTTVVEAANWLAALRQFLSTTGEDVKALTRDLVCDVKEDGTLHISQVSTNRWFRLRELDQRDTLRVSAPAAVVAAARQEKARDLEQAKERDPAWVPGPGALEPPATESLAPDGPRPSWPNWMASAPVDPVVMPDVSAQPVVAQTAPVMPAQTAPVMPTQTAPVMPAQTAPVMPAQTAPVMPAAPAAPSPRGRASDSKLEQFMGGAKVETDKLAKLAGREEEAPDGIRPWTPTMEIEEALSDIFEQTMELYSGRLDPDLIVNKLLDLAMSKIPVEAATFYITDIGTGYLQVAAARGAGARELLRTGWRIPVGQSMVGLCAMETVVLAFGAEQSNPGYVQEILARRNLEATSAICVPLDREGRNYGVIELINRKEHDSFGRADRSLLDAIAGQAVELLTKIET